MAGGANVTVTIGAAFVGSFKSVLGEADRDLRNFGKRTAKSMRSSGLPRLNPGSASETGCTEIAGSASDTMQISA